MIARRSYEEGQALLKEEMRQDGADHHRQSSHGGNKDGLCEGTGVKSVSTAACPSMFPLTYYATKFNISPCVAAHQSSSTLWDELILLTMTIIIIPVHHIQFLRYACPSPAAFPCFLVADRRPFFFMTKLVELSLSAIASSSLLRSLHPQCEVHSLR
jgi:hypothetical protein